MAIEAAQRTRQHRQPRLLPSVKPGQGNLGEPVAGQAGVQRGKDRRRRSPDDHRHAGRQRLGGFQRVGDEDVDIHVFVAPCLLEAEADAVQGRLQHEDRAGKWAGAAILADVVREAAHGRRFGGEAQAACALAQAVAQTLSVRADHDIVAGEGWGRCIAEGDNDVCTEHGVVGSDGVERREDGL